MSGSHSPTGAHPSISVVIVNWNARDDLLACLRSLRSNPPAREWETIVVDNASSDGSVERIRSEMPWVRVIANAVNRGLAAANNQGFSAADGDIVVINNPDVLFEPGTVDELADALERHPRAAFAFASLRDTDGSIQTSAGALPTLWRALAGRKRQPPLRGDSPPFSGFWWDGWAHDEEVQIGHGLEALYAVRRRAIDEIGPQDERYVLDWEGLDWCARARDAGWEVWFCPTSVAVHIGAQSVSQARYRWVVASHRGMYRYFADRSPAMVRPLLALIVSARAVAKAAAVATGFGFFSRYLNRRSARLPVA